MHDLVIYIGRIRDFDARDWLVYCAWVGLMVGLAVVTGGFVAVGRMHQVDMPPDAYMVPAGVVIFTLAIAIDTIGHRTIYQTVLQKGEALVHHVTIFCGVTSCIALSVAYSYPGLATVPAAVLTFLAFFYSVIDEAMHWQRYLTSKSDRVEMWSHVFIFVGHGIMMVGWWRWFLSGYGGVREILAVLAGALNS